MKATCEREKLLHGFQTAASVAPTRSPKPILQNVKLEVTADCAMLSATDLEVGIRMEVPGFEVSAPGTVVLPISRFGPILRESTDEKLSLESDGRSTLVRGQRSEFRLPAENPDEFPAVSLFQEEKYHELPARFFREIVRRTAFATDNESSRYALGGVLLEMSEERIAADSDRVGRVRQADLSAGREGHYAAQLRAVTKALVAGGGHGIIERTDSRSLDGHGDRLGVVCWERSYGPSHLVTARNASRV